MVVRKYIKRSFLEEEKRRKRRRKEVKKKWIYKRQKDVVEGKEGEVRECTERKTDREREKRERE